MNEELGMEGHVCGLKRRRLRMDGSMMFVMKRRRWQLV